MFKITGKPDGDFPTANNEFTISINMDTDKYFLYRHNSKEQKTDSLEELLDYVHKVHDVMPSEFHGLSKYVTYIDDEADKLSKIQEDSTAIIDETEESIMEEHIQSEFNIHSGTMTTDIPDSLLDKAANKIASALKTDIVIDDPVEQPEISYKPYGKDDFKVKVKGGYDPDELIIEAKLLGGILFISPPGNGKTTICLELARYMQGNDKPPVLINFNPTTSNSDTVGGVKIVNAKVGWEYKIGTIAEVCEQANVDPDKTHLYPIILDEINRAEPDTAFGELLTAMSKRGEAVTTNYGKKLVVPDNVIFLMTMNSYDTNINTLPEALYSRVTVEYLNDHTDDISIKLTAEDIKPVEDDRYTDRDRSVVTKLISLINTLNKTLIKDDIHGRDNIIGNRVLFANYSDLKSIELLLKKNITNQVFLKTRNLDAGTYNTCMTEIEDTWKSIKEADFNAE